MHTARSARRMHAGTAVLGHIISVARERGFRRLSLGPSAWTGPGAVPEGGLVPCGPFADYLVADGTYMTMALAAELRLRR